MKYAMITHWLVFALNTMPLIKYWLKLMSKLGLFIYFFIYRPTLFFILIIIQTFLSLSEIYVRALAHRACICSILSGLASCFKLFVSALNFFSFFLWSSPFKMPLIWRAGNLQKTLNNRCYGQPAYDVQTFFLYTLNYINFKGWCDSNWW